MPPYYQGASTLPGAPDIARVKLIKSDHDFDRLHLHVQ